MRQSSRGALSLAACIWLSCSRAICRPMARATTRMRGSTVGFASPPLSLAAASGWLAGAEFGLAGSVSSSGMFASQVLRMPTSQPEKSQAKNRDLFAKAIMTFLESQPMRLVETHEMDCVGGPRTSMSSDPNGKADYGWAKEVATAALAPS